MKNNCTLYERSGWKPLKQQKQEEVFFYFFYKKKTHTIVSARAHNKYAHNYYTHFFLLLLLYRCKLAQRYHFSAHTNTKMHLIHFFMSSLRSVSLFVLDLKRSAMIVNLSVVQMQTIMFLAFGIHHVVQQSAALHIW